MPRKARGAREQETIRKANKYMPGGSLGNTVTLDVVIDRGQGSRVWDLTGNEYVDYLLGSGPMLVGHAHPEVVEAVTETVGKGTTFFGHNENAILLAEEIVDAVPCAESVKYVSSGTEATLYAMRTARAYRKRDKILKFEGGYHGMSDYALMSLAPSEPLPDFPNPKPDSVGIPQSVQSEVLVAPFNDIETTSALIERHHDELGGVIVEPFQRVIAPKPGFLQDLREVTRQYDIPLIFDEIVTGFRFGYGGAQEYYGVTPDLSSVGKALSGGFPLAAVVGRQDIMDLLDPSRAQMGEQMLLIGTLSGNPVAAAAALATLRILRREGTYERLFATGQRVKDGLQRLLNEAEIPAQVIGHPSVFDVYFTEQDELLDYRATLKADRQKQARFTQLLLERGLYKGDNKFYISTVHNDEDIELTLSAFASAIEELGA